MSEMLLEESYVMNLSDLFHQMAFCHFAMIHVSCYDPELYMCFVECHAIFTGCTPCIFVIFVVTSTSMQSSVIVDADFRDLEFL